MFFLSQIKQRFWTNWLTLRIKPTPQKTLNRKNIFIVPTKAGFGLLLSVALILFAAINYQNNSLFLLGFTVLSIFLLSILATFENLNGLTLYKGEKNLVEQGQAVTMVLSLSQKKDRLSQALSIFCGEHQGDIAQVSHDSSHYSFNVQTEKRGVYKCPLIKIESRYPFGLIRAWSWADLCLEAVVYPKPYHAEMAAAEVFDNTSQQKRIESDDVDNIRSWQQGESPKRILWSAYAKSDELLAFEHQQFNYNPVWLDWNSVQGDTETRLAVLSYWILFNGQRHSHFGLRLPNQQFDIAIGKVAVNQALTALALYGH